MIKKLTNDQRGTYYIAEKNYFSDNLLMKKAELTKLFDEAIKYSFDKKISYSHPIKTKGKTIVTTIGKLMANICLADSYPFVNESFENGGKIGEILTDIANNYNVTGEQFGEIIWLLQWVGCKAAFISGASYNVDTFILSEDLTKKRDKIIEDFNNDKINDVEFTTKLGDLTKELIQELSDKDEAVADFVQSGGGGKAGDLQNIMLARGLAINYAGEIKDVTTAPLIEGLPPKAYLAWFYPAYASLYKKTNTIGDAGFINRKLLNVASQILYSSDDDCGTNKYFELYVNSEKLAKNLIDRYHMVGNKKTLINKLNYKELIGKKIKLRSPLYCSAKDGVCHTCVGEYAVKMEAGPGDSIGNYSALDLFNKISTICFKSAHTGVSLNKEKVNLIDEMKKFYDI